MAAPDVTFENQRRIWFTRAAKIVLPLSIAGYFLALFAHTELGIGKFLELPLILASLLVAITLLERQERALSSLTATVAALERRTTSLEGTLGGLERALAGLAAAASAADKGADVTFYRDHQFYLATRQAVEQARSRIFVSSLRGHSPDRLGQAARAHIEACRTWARSHPDHRFRRVVLRTDNEGMADFLSQELATARAAQAEDRHYHVRLLTRSRHPVEGVSVGLYDDDLVIISYIGDADRVLGFSVRSREIVKEYFEYYYEKLWASATPIERCWPPADKP